MAERLQRLRWGDGALLAVASAFWPLSVYARNLFEFVHPERLFLLIIVVWMVGVGVSLLLVMIGVQRTTAVWTVFIAIVLLMSGGRLIRQFGFLGGWVLMFAILALAVVVFARIGDTTVTRAAILSLAVVLGSGVLISTFMSWISLGESTVSVSSDLKVELVEKPDVFLIVLDGYPGLHAFALDTGEPNTATVEALEDHGFEVPQSAWSSYWLTQLSVASLLQMSYPVTEPSESDATTRDLYQLIGGTNSLLTTFTDAGYDTYYVESGWSGSSCPEVIDVCVPAPFLDEGMFFALWDTVVGPQIVRSTGYAFTAGTRKTMEWLLGNGELISSDGRPSYVFAHLVAPHPPLHLTGTCEIDTSPERQGGSFYNSGVPPEDREQYFRGQVDCVDSFMIDLANRLSPDTVIVFVGDHGTDRRSQSIIPAADWGRPEIVERMNVMMAVRSGPGCEVGDSVMVPNLMLRVLSCFSSDDLSENVNRMFIKAMVEIGNDDLAELLAMR